MSTLNLVLVSTKYSVNVGASARAGANMGASQLILVNPRCEIDENARKGAAGAQTLLQTVKIYKTLGDFYDKHKDGVRIAFTRRPGKLRQNSLYTNQLKSFKEDFPDRLDENFYLFFGPEDHGLSNDDLALMHLRCALPTYGDFYSMNLAQAVLIALYITRDFGIGPPPIIKDEPPATLTKPSFSFPEDGLKEWLTLLGFDLSAGRTNAFITLRRFFLSSIPNQQELSTLNSVIHQTIRKLKLK